MLTQKINKILKKVSKPARYAGGEFGAVETKTDASFNFLLGFCDVYEVGMSNLGIKILYGILNERKDTNCELCFAPWPDMGEVMKENDIKLFSLQSKTIARDFDMLGFSVASELNFTNVLYMLELAGLKLRAKDRKATDPIIIGGGMGLLNPMPMADFFDLIVIGEAEEVINKIADLYVEIKTQSDTKTKIKNDFLKEVASLEGVFVPSIHSEEHSKNPNQKIKKTVVKDLDNVYYPTNPILPSVEAVHNRAVLEIFRGCFRGCRFCQAGFVSRPVRFRSSEKLTEIAKELIEKTGYEEMSLSSLSTSDYPNLQNLIEQLKPMCSDANVNLSLPSTRLDAFMASHADESRKSSLTFAPEAGSQRLRDVIKKGITEDDIFNGLENAFKMGYDAVKLYFMIGLPSETQEDLDAIVELARKIKTHYKKHSKTKRSLSLRFALSTFVPKPYTPFQWEVQLSYEDIIKTQNELKDRLKKMGVKVAFHDPGTSKVEAGLSRGGSEIAKVLEKAHSLGIKFDGWTEFFNYEKWVEAFNNEGINLDKYTTQKDFETPLPWSIINIGISDEFFKDERERAFIEVVKL